MRLAQEQGLSLTGPDGLLKQLTKTVLETALNEEMTEHLGYEKHDPAGVGTGNIRNGTRAKTVLTDTTGPVELDVPRDRAATFEPQIVKKRQRRLSGVDEVVLSLYAKGLTTGEISAHFAEIYGASVSRETISRITDKVIGEMNEWAASRTSSSSCVMDSRGCPRWSAMSGQRPSCRLASFITPVPGYADILGVCAGGSGPGTANVGIISERFEERDQLVGRPVAARGRRRGGGAVECSLFEFEVGFQVNPCGGDVFVSEPQGDDGGVDAGVQEPHGKGYLYLFFEKVLVRGFFECGAREARGSVRLRAGVAAKVCVMVCGFGL